MCFRFVPASLRDRNDELNALNIALLERLQLGGLAFASSTVMNGVFWLRACILNPQTTLDDVFALIGATRQAGAECLEMRSSDGNAEAS